MNNFPSYLEIDLQALLHNYNYLKSKVNKGTKIMAMVKAYSYGNEDAIIARYLEQINIDYLGVAFTHEGIRLRKIGVKTPILVLHPISTDIQDIAKYNLELSVYKLSLLEKCVTSDVSLAVHLKFNTGLNRLGLQEEDIPYIEKLLNKNSNVFIKGVYSHLSATEDINKREFTKLQITRYENILTTLNNHNIKGFIRHILNTSGILNYVDIATYDMVRTGIGLYGYGNNPKFSKYLKPIGTFKTKISQIHHIKKGEAIGYNCQYLADKEMRIATLPIGHADGVNRIYGNENGYVYIKEKKAFILGNVCMDVIMVDITNIDCQEEDEVIIFGEKHSAEFLAEDSGTISYELITSIGRRVKRIIKK